jgi:hypothetical protein
MLVHHLLSIEAPSLICPPPRAAAAYGFALLKFQLSSEKRDFNLAPLVGVGMPIPTAHDPELPHSKRSSVYDAEAGDDAWPSKPGPIPVRSGYSSSAYSSAMTAPGLGKRHLTAPQEAARPPGPLPLPGRYMGQYYQSGAGGFPAGAFDEGIFSAMPGRSEQDTAEMAATIEQIQALNAQLTDMIGGKRSPGRLSYSEDAEVAMGGGAAAAARRQASGGEAYPV